jgi:citrate lyase beta subunit
MPSPSLSSALESTLERDARAELDALLAALGDHALAYPGDPEGRQPIHTVYGGAHLFRADTPRKLGALALAALDAHAPDAITFARALDLPGSSALPEGAIEGARLLQRFAEEESVLRAERDDLWLPLAVHRRTREKLEREPVEDFRIDFEDGLGVRSDVEEDEIALRAAHALAGAIAAGTCPAFVGIRIKALTERATSRAVRTLDLFVSALVERAGALPPGFVVTLPKITVPAQPRALVRLFERLEAKLGLQRGALRMEMMVELPQTILDAEGRSALPALLDACEGRCRGAHFGSYDFTAACDVSAAFQHMGHDACTFALMTMKIALAGRGLFLSDGATNVLPVGSTAAVHHGWREMHRNVRGSLERGLYQGWDLHPAQLPVRYAASYAFFLEGLGPAAERLRTFVDRAARATRVGNVFDDAATGQGLLVSFLRARSSGAITDAELETITGLRASEMRTRSFTEICRGRAVR